MNTTTTRVDDDEYVAPVPVEVVYRRTSPAQMWTRLVGGLMHIAFDTWLIMLLFGQVHADYPAWPHPSFWDVAAGLMIVRLAWHSPYRRVVGPRK